MSASTHAEFHARCRVLVASLGATWSRPGLEESITIELSPRLVRAIGRAMPRSRRIRLALAVADAPNATVAEVVCHEVAHIVAWDLFGPSVRPHGREWAALMRAAGFKPRIRLDPASRGLRMPDPRTSAATRPRPWLYEHRCPVCRASRTSGRVVRRWRCARCVRAGLDGELVVERRPRGAPSLRDRARAALRNALAPARRDA
ncbi:MAG: SprT-like domain-containing protein [Alphaproteobacteria bacterium]